MAYDRQFLSINYLFDIQNTEETATTAINLSGASTNFDALAALDEVSSAGWDEILDAMADLLQASPLRWANYSELVGLKAAAHGTDGRYLGEPVIWGAGSELKGAQAAVVPQETIVISLRTNTTFGQGNYGRCYLPHTSMALDGSTPFVAQTDCATVATNARTWLSRVNTVSLALNEPADVRIMSSRTTGTARPVTRVGVGNVVDTQRRRRHQLNEVYSFATM